MASPDDRPRSADLDFPEPLREQTGVVSRRAPRIPGIKERIEIRRVPELPGAELWTVTGSSRLWTVFNERYAFCTAEFRGPHSWQYRQGTYQMRQGSTMLLEPGEVHATTEMTMSDFRLLIVDPSTMSREFEGEKTPPGHHFGTGQADDPRLVAPFRRLEMEAADGDPFGRRAMFRYYLEALFTQAGELPARIEARACALSLEKARAMLEDRYREGVKLDEVAAEVGLSKYHLERTFRVRFGVPMHRYLKAVRLTSVCLALAEGQKAGEVACAVGFYDHAHLTRAFRQELGVAPNVYRRGNGL